MTDKSTEIPIILIERDGGLIHHITGNVMADVIIVDFDTEGLDDEEISTIKGKQVWLSSRNIDNNSVSYKYLKSVHEKANYMNEGYEYS